MAPFGLMGYGDSLPFAEETAFFWHLQLDYGIREDGDGVERLLDYVPDYRVSNKGRDRCYHVGRSVFL